MLTLSLPPDLHPGLDGMSQALAALGPELADSLRQLADHGSEPAICVFQELADDHVSFGFYLSIEALEWAVRARTEFIVDQYVVDAEP